MAIAAMSTGCVVFPTHVYVADAADGAPVYERCSLNPDVPVGVRVDRPGLQAIVSLVQERDGGFVAVRYDLAEHHTLQLLQDVITIDARDGQPPRSAPVPHVNPSGPASHEPPAVLPGVLPVDATLQGARIRLGDVSFDRHYWIAGRFGGRIADDVRVTLPRFSLDAVPNELPAIHFSRRAMIARGLFNC